MLCQGPKKEPDSGHLVVWPSTGGVRCLEAVLLVLVVAFPMRRGECLSMLKIGESASKHARPSPTPWVDQMHCLDALLIYERLATCIKKISGLQCK